MPSKKLLVTKESLLAEIKTYISEEKDLALIEKAIDYAYVHHEGQFRKSGEPYVVHLLNVGYILATLKVGPRTICAGLLHDTIEDTGVSKEELSTEFDEEIATMVESVTKIGNLKFKDEKEYQAANHRKIFIAMARDVRVIIVKLADRLHNMRTLQYMSEEKQHKIASETLEVYAPIAHRLGISEIKNELEDLSFFYLNREEYYRIAHLVEAKKNERDQQVQQMIQDITKLLQENHLEFRIFGRSKHLYSIYKKMVKKHKRFEEILDLLAIRIVTKTELNCYEILGYIHAKYRPIPGRLKDYIAMPKMNMYQSLHTSIIAGDGNVFEVQIRTKEMDEIAETGVAAHWRYKEGSHYSPKQEQHEIEEKLHWFRDFLHLNSETQDKNATEYMESLSKDIFEANVYVFTPKGKVVDLPNGSTPLDLAYKIHTKVGDMAVGALVNNNLVPLNTILKTGDVVEIRTSKTASGPNESWLNIVKTASAKSHIKKFLQKKNASFLRDDKIRQGKQVCEDFFKDRGIDEKEMMNLLNTEKVLKNYQVSTIDDLFILICAHNPNPGQIADFLGIKKKEDGQNKLFKKENFDDDNCPVTVDGQTGFKITLGNCCTPIPGDSIVGYVTKGKGITVHRINCPNVAGLTSRLISVHWKEDLGIKSYPVDIVIECVDRQNLVADILNIFNSNKIKCTELSAKFHPDSNQTSVYAQIYVSDANVLSHVEDILKSTKDVYDVKRVIH